MSSDITSVTPNITTIEEGRAKITLTSENVFYNPVQEFNRDLSIAVLRTFLNNYKAFPLKKRGVIDNSDNNTDVDPIQISILEALSATGLRSIRYAKEIPGITRIVANDISPKAVESIKSNAQLNDVQHLIETTQEDATLLMYKHRRMCDRFSAVDLDPYGCPSTFLDSAVQCCADGGLLLVTATDMAVLAGNSPETCYSKYGAISLRWKACHEQALRILLQCIESHANRYGRYIEPLLSVSADFYIRVFVKMFTGPAQCKKTTSKLSMVYQCVGCDTFTLQPLGTFKPNPGPNDPNRLKAVLPHAPPLEANCKYCQQRQHMGGPMWTGPLHSSSFVTDVLDLVQKESNNFSTAKRMEGILSMVREELTDVPFYYTIPKLCSTLHLEIVPMLTMRSVIMNAGYRVSYSHACKTSLKTDAPPDLLWDILRTWEKKHPVKKERLQDDGVAKYILSQPILNKIDFSERMDANPVSRRDGCLRFQYNPTSHWGPGSRATAKIREDRISKSKRNQNKKNKHKELQQETEENLKRERETSPNSLCERKVTKTNSDSDISLLHK